eukprot:2404485-Pyramimonas_sp.AAC.1
MQSRARHGHMAPVKNWRELNSRVTRRLDKVVTVNPTVSVSSPTARITDNYTVMCRALKPGNPYMVTRKMYSPNIVAGLLVVLVVGTVAHGELPTIEQHSSEYS